MKVYNELGCCGVIIISFSRRNSSCLGYFSDPLKPMKANQAFRPEAATNKDL